MMGFRLVCSLDKMIAAASIPAWGTNNFEGQHGKGTLSNQAKTPPQIWQSERLHSRYDGEAKTA
jgi:hypothetical protein